MTISKVNKQQFLRRLNLLTTVLIILMALASPATAQSTDPDDPVPMTTNVIKGRLSGDKPIAHYYSFVGGPGEIEILFDFVSDESAQLVAGRLTDADGRTFISIDEEYRKKFGPPYDLVQDIAYPQGLRLIGRYEVKRKQKLVVKVYTWGLINSGVKYTIRIEGDGASFNQSDAATNNALGNNNSANKTVINNNASGNRASCLPKSGKLRLVMDDGTVQEINLGRVSEASIKP
jgi:hypothetical protein